MFNSGNKKFLQFYPIGSVYETTNADFNPNTSWGGTWELLKDRFLIGAGSSYTIGNTGGSANLIACIGNNNTNGKLGMKRADAQSSFVLTYTWIGGASASSENPTSEGTAVIGQTDGSSSLPPYLAVFMWHRIS